jgi:ribosomal protein L11 methyltransferase
MINQTYFRVRIKKIPSSLESDVTDISFKFGCSGISEVLSYIQKDLVYDPELRPMRFRDIDVFFSDRPSNPYFEELKILNANIGWEVVEEVHKDWLEEWKKGFKPFPLVGTFWVVPSWFECPKEAENPLFIDPGMAFGTGTHATTQMAAALVYRIFKKKVPGQDWQVIDIGTGTAILAMLAKKSGATRVVGLDVDPEARRVARENIERNNVIGVEIQDRLLEEVRESYDLVVANIIDGVLLRLKNDLCRILKHQGHLILTGILEERESGFLDQFLAGTDLKVDLRLAKEEWVGYLLSTKDSSRRENV